MSYTLDELKAMGMGNGGFNLGYGSVKAGDLIEGGLEKYHTGQVLEIFQDGGALIKWDDCDITQTLPWRYIRRRNDC